jgi:hypothetical protein
MAEMAGNQLFQRGVARIQRLACGQIFHFPEAVRGNAGPRFSVQAQG